MIAERASRLDWRCDLQALASLDLRSYMIATNGRVSKRLCYVTRDFVRSGSTVRPSCSTHSGSINAALVEILFAKIRAIWSIGATVEVIESDVAVRRPYALAGRTPAELKGRGGTSFDPAFEGLRAVAGDSVRASPWPRGLCRDPLSGRCAWRSGSLVGEQAV
jgi:predicted metal-dependent peptidase